MITILAAAGVLGAGWVMDKVKPANPDSEVDEDSVGNPLSEVGLQFEKTPYSTQERFTWPERTGLLRSMPDSADDEHLLSNVFRKPTDRSDPRFDVSASARSGYIDDVVRTIPTGDRLYNKARRSEMPLRMGSEPQHQRMTPAERGTRAAVFDGARDRLPTSQNYNDYNAHFGGGEIMLPPRPYHPPGHVQERFMPRDILTKQNIYPPVQGHRDVVAPQAPTSSAPTGLRNPWQYSVTGHTSVEDKPNSWNPLTYEKPYTPLSHTGPPMVTDTQSVMHDQQHTGIDNSIKRDFSARKGASSLNNAPGASYSEIRDNLDREVASSYTGAPRGPLVSASAGTSTVHGHHDIEIGRVPVSDISDMGPIRASTETIQGKSLHFDGTQRTDMESAARTSAIQNAAVTQAAMRASVVIETSQGPPTTETVSQSKSIAATAQ